MKLVTKHFEEAADIDLSIPMHRVLIADCSYSMYSELPKLRTHLKNKLPTLVAPDDVFTLIWFSSQGQCGTIFEAVSINTATDLSKINAAIDRFLVPVGATGFKDPLELTLKLATAKSDLPVSMFFLTDGYENCSPKKEVIKACANLADVIATSCMVSYGYYADEKFLGEMAEELGGELIGAGDFNAYEDVLTRVLKTRASGKRKVVEGLPGDTVIVGHMDESYVVVKPDASGKAVFPSNTIAYSYFTAGSGIEDELAAVQVVGALIQRGEADRALELAEEIGDNELFALVQNAFSKQDFNRVVSFVGTHLAYSKSPKNTKLKTDPNAYNVLTLLMDLADTEGNYLHISHPEFKYSAIGSKRESAPDENGFIPVFTSKTGEVKAEISALKFDEDRPNVSILTRRDGQVSLPDNDFGFGNAVDSFIWRNYAIVRDGIVNVSKLPVVLTKATYDLLIANGIQLEPFKVNQTYVIDVSTMPVINRSMAQPMTAREMFDMDFELYQLRTAQKILNSRIEKPEVSAEYASKFGPEAAEFLKKYGVGPGGFSPKTVKGEAIDPYIAKALEVKISGLSGIPKVSEVEDDVKAGKKLTPSKQVMANKLKALEPTVGKEAEALWALKKNMSVVRDRLIKAKFGIILCRKWFTDLGSYDNTELTLDYGLGKPLKATVNLVDKEV